MTDGESMITKEEYFKLIAQMFIDGDGVFEDSEEGELWFDVTDIRGRDLRGVISRLNAELKSDGMITASSIYGMGEGHLWFSEKALAEIERMKHSDKRDI